MADSFIRVPPDSTGKQVATNEVGGKQFQIVNLADSTGAPITPLTEAQLPLTDAQLRADAVPVAIQGVDNVALGTQLVDGDVGVVTNTVIHGKTTAGGGSFVDVKVNPSGALSVAVGESSLPTGAASDATLQAVLALTDSVNTLVQFLYANSPRLDAFQRVVGNNSETTQPVSGTVGANVLTVAGYTPAFSMQDVPFHIYDNISGS